MINIDRISDYLEALLETLAAVDLSEEDALRLCSLIEGRRERGRKA